MSALAHDFRTVVAQRCYAAITEAFSAQVHPLALPLGADLNPMNRPIENVFRPLR